MSASAPRYQGKKQSYKKRSPLTAKCISRHLSAEHGIVCHLPGERFGYFGWPSVERLADGKLIVASSGLRSEHICPWGKTVLNTSDDDGATWSEPRVIHDSPIDDRDAGLLDLGDGNVLVTWASVDNRLQLLDATIKQAFIDHVGQEEVDSWTPTLEALPVEEAEAFIGSWAMHSTDRGATWGEKVKVPVYTPHGPIKLRNGDLMYLGNRFETDRDQLDDSPAVAARSTDDGLTWTVLGTVPKSHGLRPGQQGEPDVLELPSGKLIGMIRVGGQMGKSGVPNFSMMQTESVDGGESWSLPTALDFHGSPPHVIQHSSGALILTYGYRLVPFGQRVAISNDEGQTWDSDWILRDDGPDWDLGYPSTVEMPDSSLFSVYYQKVPGDYRNSLHWSRWTLPS